MLRSCNASSVFLFSIMDTILVLVVSSSDIPPSIAVTKCDVIIIISFPSISDIPSDYFRDFWRVECLGIFLQWKDSISSGFTHFCIYSSWNYNPTLDQPVQKVNRANRLLL